MVLTARILHHLVPATEHASFARVARYHMDTKRATECNVNQ